MSDAVNVMYRSPHNLITCSELHNRNSIMWVIDFYEKKAKDILVTIRPSLATLVHTYELSCNGTGQRSEDDED